jgi:hypothetical protein
MFTYPDFFSDEECAMLVRLIDDAARPSTLLAVHEDPEFRTSSSTDLDRWSEEIWPIDDRIAHALGLPPVNAETLQGQRYEPGQQFRAHCDYFHENAEYWDRMVETGGQRTGPGADLLFGRRAANLTCPSPKGGTVQISPAWASAASTALRLASLAGVIGKRSSSGNPGRTLVIAYFTGPGEASVNIARCSG